MLSVFKLNGVMDCRWADRFMPCLEEGSQISSMINTGSGTTFIDLHSVTCVQYTLSEDLLCSCQMDCLFSFQASSATINVNVYVYLAAISCNASQVDQVKDFLRSPQASVTYINGSFSHTPCNMTGQIPF